MRRHPDYGDGGAIVCKAAGTIAPDNPAAMFLIMTDLMQIISNGQANVRLEITGEDLHKFSNELITRAVSEVAAALKGAEEDRLLTRDEVYIFFPTVILFHSYWIYLFYPRFSLHPKNGNALYCPPLPLSGSFSCSNAIV